MCLESKGVELHLVCENFKEGHSEATKPDCSIGRQNGLLGTKLQRLSLGVIAEQMIRRKASRVYVTAGWGL